VRNWGFGRGFFNRNYQKKDYDFCKIAEALKNDLIRSS